MKRKHFVQRTTSDRTNTDVLMDLTLIQNIPYIPDQEHMTMKTMNLSVRLTAPLTAFVSQRVGVEGDYDNASEYVRDLIRRDRDRTEEVAFRRLKSTLRDAHAAPDADYVQVSAAEVVARNRSE
ncbi:hypothetical protein [Minwuia sp.]|uniref:hypothetical protein n=1 Tax=Minwuia sp. TaxID=2493630 RepID=UPI003A902887